METFFKFVQFFDGMIVGFLLAMLIFWFTTYYRDDRDL